MNTSTMYISSSLGVEFEITTLCSIIHEPFFGGGGGWDLVHILYSDHLLLAKFQGWSPRLQWGRSLLSHTPSCPPPPIYASPYPHHTPAYWYHHGILLHITEQSFLFQSSQDCLSSFKPWHALWAMKTRHQSHDLQHEEHMTTHTSHMCTYTHLELWADICDAPTVIHHLNEG